MWSERLPEETAKIWVTLPQGKGQLEPSDAGGIKKALSILSRVSKGSKTIPKKKKCKKAKWLSEETLQISVKREGKSKGEKERYSHLNAEFQRTARRDKKAFLTGQCKEIEENNRMWKTRDLFKKVGNTKGTFHAKMGSINDRNGMDLTEAEDIKKMWQ